MSAVRDQVGTGLLVVGYPAAVWALARAVPMFRQRRRRRFLVAQAGTASVAVGWALRDRAAPAVINAAAVAVFATVWWIGGRRRRA